MSFSLEVKKIKSFVDYRRFLNSLIIYASVDDDRMGVGTIIRYDGRDLSELDLSHTGYVIKPHFYMEVSAFDIIIEWKGKVYYSETWELVEKYNELINKN